MDCACWLQTFLTGCILFSAWILLQKVGLLSLAAQDVLHTVKAKVLTFLPGGIVKLPQIYKIINSKSVRGVSLTSYLLDTASQLIAVAYNIRQHFPFNTYGESAFLTIQNVLIILLILAYSHQSGKTSKALTFIAITGASTHALLSNDITPISVLRSLLALSIPLSLSSKIPQIATIASSGTTGQLSAFTVFSSLLGTLARVFTTATETGDKTLWWSFVLASVLNGVIALQMLWHWKTPAEPARAKVEEKIQEAKRLAQPVPANPLQGTIPVGATPAKPVHVGNGVPRSATRSAPRSASSRYTRKVD